VAAASSHDDSGAVAGRRIAIGPLAVLLLGGVVSLILLFTNHTDGSYTCRGSSIAGVIKPEPEASAAFRRDFFDSGRQCNLQARANVGAGAGGLLISTGGAFLWHRRRRDNRVA
jgi:hypothetical protein